VYSTSEVAAVPGVGFDPALSLAMAVHAQPGGYALLVVSGLSSAAEIRRVGR